MLRLYFVDAPETQLLYPERTREQAEHFGATLDDTLKAGARARSFVREALRGPFTVTTRKASAPGRARDPRFYGMVASSIFIAASFCAAESPENSWRCAAEAYCSISFRSRVTAARWYFA